ncbi:MAG: hypothetical protein PHY18_06685 [Dehalococcoidales bacterium]|nr:hypothetical protein [Dehalococcoidales bacterium]
MVSSESQFRQNYSSLIKKFRNHAKSEGTFYLPNPIVPKERADYILIGMEPSFGRWAKGKNPVERSKVAQGFLNKGFKNFAFTIEDFIMHYCTRTYLCSESETYYVTDLSKGAMLTKDAGKNRSTRYLSWYPLLLDEIKSISKKRVKLIALGKSVYDFLMKQKCRVKTGCNLYYVPHYSNQASWVWNKFISNNAYERNEFFSKLDVNRILEVANNILKKCNMDYSLEEKIYAALPKQLTESKKKLILTYKTCFEQIKTT